MLSASLVFKLLQKCGKSLNNWINYSTAECVPIISWSRFSMPRSWRCLWNISRSLLPFFENYANCSFLIKWLQPETLKTAVTLLKHERSRRVRHLPFTWENREFRLQNQMVHARSLWEASENIGRDLRRFNILLLLGCTTDLDMLYSYRVKFSSINFMHKIACITGALWAKRGERCIVRAARDESPLEPPLVSRFALVSRFSQNAAFASLSSWSACYAGYAQDFYLEGFVLMVSTP